MDGFCDYPRHRDGPLAADDLAAKGGLDGSGELAKERPRLSRPAGGEAVTAKAPAAAAVTPAGDNSAVGFMLCALPVALVYINFMVTTDVPMYYNAWVDDTNKGVVYPTFLEGMADLVQCEVVETAFEPWREAIVWQTGYFGVMPLMAVASLAHKISEPVEAVEAVVKGKGPRRSSRLKAH